MILKVLVGFLLGFILGVAGAVFMVTSPIDGQPACCANGGTVGFNFDTTEEVDAWHRRGVEAGQVSAVEYPESDGPNSAVTHDSHDCTVRQVRSARGV